MPRMAVLPVAQLKTNQGEHTVTTSIQNERGSVSEGSDGIVEQVWQSPQKT